MEYQLLKQRIKKDRRTQTEVYDKYCQKVYRSCLRILGDQHEAEDFMQEAFIQSFDRIDSFRGDSDLGTWICRIAINKCLDHLKKRRVKLEYSDETARHGDREVQAFEADSEFDLNRVLNALKELPEGSRLVFNLHIFEELDHKTIGEKLGIKEGSSRLQYARAKNRIKELIKENYV